MIPPTARQMQLLRFIAGYLEAHGYGPSFSEMAAGIGGTGKGSVCCAVDRLEERGHIRRLRHRERTIELLHPVAVPHAPDGAPLYAVRWAA